MIKSYTLCVISILLFPNYSFSMEISNNWSSKLELHINNLIFSLGLDSAEYSGFRGDSIYRQLYKQKIPPQLWELAASKLDIDLSKESNPIIIELLEEEKLRRDPIKDSRSLKKIKYDDNEFSPLHDLTASFESLKLIQHLPFISEFDLDCFIYFLRYKALCLGVLYIEKNYNLDNTRFINAIILTIKSLINAIYCLAQEYTPDPSLELDHITIFPSIVSKISNPSENKFYLFLREFFNDIKWNNHVLNVDNEVEVFFQKRNNIICSSLIMIVYLLNPVKTDFAKEFMNELDCNYIEMKTNQLILQEDNYFNDILLFFNV